MKLSFGDIIAIGAVVLVAAVAAPFVGDKIADIIDGSEALI